MLEIVVGVGFLAVIAANLLIGRRNTSVTEPEKVKDSSFICPYCQNVVTGFRELDLIHHVSCIGKSQADLEAEAKKPKAPADEYFTTYSRHKTNWNGQYNSKYDWTYISRENYERYGWTLWRNGKEIAFGSGPTKAHAEIAASEAMALDKHKRRTAAKRG